jgi:riboflavin synthase
MFTGLIETVGSVRALKRVGGGGRLSIAASLAARELQLGESIAVNGACLTVVEFGDGYFVADVSPETLERTTLATLAPRSRVNLERALCLGDRLGGHLVSGHIDTVAEVVERRQDANAIRFTFRLPNEFLPYLVEKGSVAIDGISLTVNQVAAETFSVAIIPHTLELTTLAALQVGGRANVEVDILAKYVERLLGTRMAPPAKRSGVDFDLLAKHGFV